jgi:enoyl-CoA hydratase/carnithine racemase
VPPGQFVTVSLPSSDTPALWAALAAAGRDLTGDVRVVVLRADAADFFDAAQPDNSDDEPPAAAIEWLGRPDLITLAAVSGRTTGAGLDVALACDLRIVSDDAQLSTSRSIGSIGRLGDLMGAPRALAFVLAGEPISGAQAASSGLANLSVPPEKLDAAVAEMVATVLRTPREVATVAKAVLRASATDRRRLADEFVAGIRLAANEP